MHRPEATWLPFCPRIYRFSPVSNLRQELEDARVLQEDAVAPGTRPWQRPAEGEKRRKASPGELLAPLCSHRRHARGKEKAKAAAWPLKKQTALGGWAIKCQILSLVGEEENPRRAGRQDFRVKDGEVSLKLGSPQIFCLKCEIFQLLMGEKKRKLKPGEASTEPRAKTYLHYFWGAEIFQESLSFQRSPQWTGHPTSLGQLYHLVASFSKALASGDSFHNWYRSD